MRPRSTGAKSQENGAASEASNIPNDRICRRYRDAKVRKAHEKTFYS